MFRFNAPPLPYSDIYIRPVIPLLILLMSGIFMGVYYPGQGLWVYIATGLAAFFVLAHIIIKKPARLSPLILFLCLGYLSIQPLIAPYYPSNHVIRFLDAQKWQITGTVDQEPVIEENRIQFALSVHQLDFYQIHHQVVGKIKVTVSGYKIPTLGKGDKVVFSSRILTIRNFNNPGAFNYKQYMAFKRISGSAYVRADKFIILEKRTGPLIKGIITQYRNQISSLINSTLPDDAGKILNALVIGKRSEIDPPLANRFNRAGLGHLLAISGLHVGIVASVTFLGLTWLLSRFKFFLWHAWARKGAAMLSVFPVLLYGMLAGMSPSTQRAVLMVGVFLMAFPIEREQDTPNTLAIAAMIILIISPYAMLSISFQLSFTAVFFIIYGLPKQDQSTLSKKSIWGDLKVKLFQFVIVSVLAIAGTLPLIMYYFNQISFAGIFSNLIGVPMIGFIVVPVGILSAFIYPISPFLTSVGFKICGMVLKPALAIINAIADLPFAAMKTITPNLFEMGCAYLLLLSILVLIKKQSNNSPTTYLIPRLLIVLCTLGIFCDVGYYIYQRYGRTDLRITMLDVGQGNAALLELPKGHNILIDGGGFPDNAIFDVGERLVAPFLWRKKITTVDTIILSRANIDHYNGLTYIANHFHVKQVWTNDQTPSNRSFIAFKQAILKNNISFPKYKSIPRHLEIAGVILDILHPGIDDKCKNNNHSLVIKITFGNTSFLFPGDILAQGERTLVRQSGKMLNSTVLLSPHHGSRSSSTDIFLNAVKPDIVVISCGWKNRFHMPHDEVLSRYEKRSVQIFRTDHHGAITLISDGQNLMVGHAVHFEGFSGESYQ